MSSYVHHWPRSSALRPAVAPQLKGRVVSYPGNTHPSPSARRSTRGTRSRSFVATRDVHTSRGSLRCPSAEISLYFACGSPIAVPSLGSAGRQRPHPTFSDLFVRSVTLRRGPAAAVDVISKGK